MLPAAVPADGLDCTDTQIDALSICSAYIGDSIRGGETRRYSGTHPLARKQLRKSSMLSLRAVYWESNRPAICGACMLMDRNCDNRLGLSGGGRLALACVAIKPLKGADTLGMCYQ